VKDLAVYFSPSLRPKEGCNEIRVFLRGSFFFRWLEIEGAKAIASLVRA
jgi:hypothetical protein